MSALKFYLFGLPRIEQEGQPIKIERRKSLALAAYLALNPQPQSRDTLAALLWPEYDQSAARGSLSNTLWHLKKVCGRDWLTLEREQVVFNPQDTPWVDVHEFKFLLAQAKAHAHSEEQVCNQCVPSLNQAAALYQEDFMAGFSVPESETFEAWKTAQADALRRDFERILEKLVQYYDTKEEFEPAVGLAERWLRLDPLNEEVHWHLMRLHARSGRPIMALRQYEECARLLNAELQIQPQDKLNELRKAIREQRPAVCGAVTVEKAPPKKPGQEPWPLGLCIGREKEIAEINRLLADPNCRLLTLVGPGGIGKTTLALQALHAKNEQSPGGFFYIPLAGLLSHEWIVPVIADALGFLFSKEADPEKQLAAYLGDKEFLLILDNFEHLMEGVNLLADLLVQAKGIKFLVTSQQRLNLKEEWILDVRGLDYPADESIREIEQFGAVRLLLQRLKQIEPRFSLAEDEKPFIIRICRLLDGMPLGIELAAAWSRLLSCREIAAHMEQDLDFLSVSLRDLPKRHHSLHAVFERSWGFLNEEEKTVFKKLSVFRGGFTKEAAKRVAGASLLVLLSLKNKSFLHDLVDGRYGMSELLRKFVLEKSLPESEIKTAVQELHADYFAGLFDKEDKYYLGDRQKTMMGGIGIEIDNFRAGWDWTVAHGKLTTIDLYLETLFYFYEQKGWFFQGEEALAKAVKVLQKSGGERAEVQIAIGRMLSLQGWFCHYPLHMDKAQELIKAGIAIHRRLGRDGDLGEALNKLSYIHFTLGHLEECEMLARESRLLCEKTGDFFRMAEAMRYLGIVHALRGEYDRAEALYAQCLAINQRAGKLRDLPNVYGNLGIIAELQGDYGRAVHLHRKSLAYYLEEDNPVGLADQLNNLGFAFLSNGEHWEGLECFKKSFRICLETQAMAVMNETMLGMAFFLAAKGADNERALEIAAHTAHDHAAHIDTRRRAERLMAELKARFSEDDYQSLTERARLNDFRYYLDWLRSHPMIR